MRIREGWRLTVGTLLQAPAHARDDYLLAVDVAHGVLCTYIVLSLRALIASESSLSMTGLCPNGYADCNRRLLGNELP